MSQIPEPAISIRIDPANPGQFFACCGLLESADRLWNGAEGWFEEVGFFIRPLTSQDRTGRSLGELVLAIAGVSLLATDPEDDYSSPIQMPDPFDLRLDWWHDHRTGGDRLKPWAGSMRGVRIARAMQNVLRWEELHTSGLLDYSTVVYDRAEPDKKVEPFYFDARRGASALPIDIGFSPDSLHMTNLAYPAVEFLCLVGLQRFRPMPTGTPRVFDYYTWTIPLGASVAALAAAGLFKEAGVCGFRFEVAFRTDQRKHKAFTPATPLGRS